MGWEFVGFTITFICFPTQQVLANRKDPIYGQRGKLVASAQGCTRRTDTSHRDHLAHLHPNVPSCDVAQDLCGADPTQEACPRSCRSYKIMQIIQIIQIMKIRNLSALKDLDHERELIICTICVRGFCCFLPKFHVFFYVLCSYAFFFFARLCLLCTENSPMMLLLRKQKKAMMLL